MTSDQSHSETIGISLTVVVSSDQSHSETTGISLIVVVTSLTVKPLVLVS